MAEPLVTRTCTVCNAEKSLDEFVKEARCEGGRRHQCKACRIAARREYFPPEKAAEYQRAYRKTAHGHAAHMRGHKKWRQGEKGKAYDQRPDVRAYRKVKLRRYQDNNPVKVAARLAVKKARMRGAIPRASELPCAHCGAQATDYHHHKGYSPEHALDVIPLCRACHQQAG